MSLAGREVLRRHQYAAEMVSCVLVIGNSMTTLCVGDSRAAYELLARRGDRGQLPPYEQWRSAMLFDGDANGGHVVLKARADGARAFVDLTFGHVTVATKGAIQVPPAFAGFGEIEWPAAQMGDVWFHYGPGAESVEMRDITVQEWSGLIDDLQTLVDIALGYGNDEQVFAAEMRRQVQQLGR
jgi:hypothetical protein